MPAPPPVIACATSGEHVLPSAPSSHSCWLLLFPPLTIQLLPRSTFSSATQAQCVSCQPGTYNDAKDASACKLCPAGTYSLVGAVSVEQCQVCPALTVASSAGTSKCQNCGDNESPAGSFRSSPDRRDCECTDGYYADLDSGLGVDKACRTCPRRGATCTKDRIIGQVRLVSKLCWSGFALG
jgi:hypothetical protein